MDDGPGAALPVRAARRAHPHADLRASRIVPLSGRRPRRAPSGSLASVPRTTPSARGVTPRQRQPCWGLVNARIVRSSGWPGRVLRRSGHAPRRLRLPGRSPRFPSLPKVGEKCRQVLGGLIVGGHRQRELDRVGAPPAPRVGCDGLGEGRGLACRPDQRSDAAVWGSDPGIAAVSVAHKHPDREAVDGRLWVAVSVHAQHGIAGIRRTGPVGRNTSRVGMCASLRRRRSGLLAGATTSSRPPASHAPVFGRTASLGSSRRSTTPSSRLQRSGRFEGHDAMTGVALRLDIPTDAAQLVLLPPGQLDAPGPSAAGFSRVRPDLRATGDPADECAVAPAPDEAARRRPHRSAVHPPGE